MDYESKRREKALNSITNPAGRHARWSGLLLGLIVLSSLVLLEIQVVRKIGGEYFLNRARLKGSAQEFLHNMKQSLSLDSSNGFAHFLLSRYYLETRTFEGALSEALLARKTFGSFNGLMQVGSIYLKMHSYNKAIETFRQVHRMVPGNVLAQNYLAYSYLGTNDVEQAEKELLAILSKDCLNPNALYLMGLASDISGKRRLGRYYHYWAFLQRRKGVTPFYDREYLIQRIRAVS